MCNTMLLTPIIFCLAFLSLGGDCLKVQIFKDIGFKGLIYDYSSNAEEIGCHDLKEYARGDAGSVETDTCLMIYESLGCNGNSYKLSRDKTDDLRDLRRPIYSFHVCNSTHGGDVVQIDMFSASSELIARYKDICGCQDIPTSVTTRLQKLNNYGNCITVYSTATCSGGENKEIPAGQNRQAEDLPELGFYVRSVSACGERKACVRLNSEIFKFVFRVDTKRLAGEQPKSKMIDLATKTVFYNNGSATVLQEYAASRTVRESTTIGRSTKISQMHSSTVDSKVVSQTEKDLGNVNLGIYKYSKKMTETVKETYKNEKSSEEKFSESHTNETETTFSVKQTIQVPPCSQYEVFSTVEVLQDMPLIYDVYTRITGESSGRPMTAEELSRQVDGLTFVENFDEYTAIYMSTHSLSASIGVDTKISGEGKPMPGCRISG